MGEEGREPGEVAQCWLWSADGAGAVHGEKVNSAVRE